MMEPFITNSKYIVHIYIYLKLPIYNISIYKRNVFVRPRVEHIYMHIIQVSPEPSIDTACNLLKFFLWWYLQNATDITITSNLILCIWYFHWTTLNQVCRLNLKYIMIHVGFQDGCWRATSQNTSYVLYILLVWRSVLII